MRIVIPTDVREQVSVAAKMYEGRRNLFAMRKPTDEIRWQLELNTWLARRCNLLLARDQAGIDWNAQIEGALVQAADMELFGSTLADRYRMLAEAVLSCCSLELMPATPQED